MIFFAATTSCRTENVSINDRAHNHSFIIIQLIHTWLLSVFLREITVKVSGKGNCFHK